jgi:hypothetical protein
LRFVFGFYADDQGANVPSSLPAANVYECRRIIQSVSQGVAATQLDYALLKLDRTVVNRVPFAYRTSDAISSSASLVGIGYPNGLPEKLATGSVIRNLASELRFYDNLDLFGGNSGGPVIDLETGIVEGITVTGPSVDFLFRDLGNGESCVYPRECPETGCGSNAIGSGAMRFTSVLPAFQCDDGVKNGSETDVDCGGSCGHCSLEKVCATAADCDTLNCANGRCAPPSCSDGQRNQDEIDVDCGGSGCPPCGEHRQCRTNDQCQSHLVCISSCEYIGTSGCIDGAQDFRETDVDCGGTMCQPCAEGQACLLTADCQVGMSCVNGVCSRPDFCFDGVTPGYGRDAGETDLDCGGPCRPCGQGKRCFIADDCEKGLFCVGGICDELPMMCADNVMDVSETDIDCGGHCPGCGVRQGCRENSDCQAGLYCAFGACRSPSTPATCYDDAFPGLTMHGETAKDCGGPCNPCITEGNACLEQADCANAAGLACLGLECNSALKALCNNGRVDYQETSVDCGGGFCPPCGEGKVCIRNADCAEPFACINSFCQTPHD